MLAKCPPAQHLAVIALAALLGCGGHGVAATADASGDAGPAACAACVAPTPYCIQAIDKWVCVGCVSDDDCAPHGLGSCMRPQHKCSGVGTLAPDCAVCTGATPACFFMDHGWYCAGCLNDDDCALTYQGTCTPQTYACSIATPGCKTDGDCRQRSATAFDLACDVTHALCYDKQGRCDNLSAYCLSELGSQCGLPAALTGSDERHCSCVSPACTATATTAWDCGVGLACGCTGSSGSGFCGL